MLLNFEGDQRREKSIRVVAWIVKLVRSIMKDEVMATRRMHV